MDSERTSKREKVRVRVCKKEIVKVLPESVCKPRGEGGEYAGECALCENGREGPSKR